ncbi:MAG: flagellar M-ring protein FliF [Planctomycetes bacterium]|nr:flagellar M-ring protein FliF [Planctomycetota bacterium]
MQRVLLLGVLLGCAGGLFVLVNWARRPNMALLYSGLAPEEAATIVEKIRDQGLAYELKQGGTAIYVPQDKVYSLRLTMASAGLPTGDNRGYQILDQGDIGESPFAERVKYKRAIEGEIARSIQTLDAVTAARVHVVQPESGLFRKDGGNASATVVLKLRGGYRLSSSNVAAIVHLVAGAVAGLSPDKVVVVDAHGRLLSGESKDTATAGLGTVFEQKQQIEQYLADKAEQQLARVLGPNRATVKVAVELDPTSVETETTKYGPDKGVTTREMIKESRTTQAPAQKGAPPQETSDTTTETEYKVSETHERRIQLGDIKSKHVSVIVDLTPPESAGKSGQAAGIMTVKDVEEVVKAALGLRIGASSGTAGAAAAGTASAAAATDQLVVKEAKFYQPPEAADLGSEGSGLLSKDFLLKVAQRMSLAVLVIGALLALRMFRGKKPAGEQAEALQALAAAGTAGGAALLPGAAGGEANTDALKAQITRALQDNPEEVKRLFLSWIESDKGEG